MPLMTKSPWIHCKTQRIYNFLIFRKPSSWRLNQSKACHSSQHDPAAKTEAFGNSTEYLQAGIFYRMRKKKVQIEKQGNSLKKNMLQKRYLKELMWVFEVLKCVEFLPFSCECGFWCFFGVCCLVRVFCLFGSGFGFIFFPGGKKKPPIRNPAVF